MDSQSSFSDQIPPISPSLSVASTTRTRTTASSLDTNSPVAICEPIPGSVSTFVDLDSTGLASLKDEEIEISSPDKFNSATTSSGIIEEKIETQLVPGFLEPIADFILTLHRCVQGDVQSDQLEKSIKCLSSSFRNADTNGRQLLITQLINRETKVIRRLLTAVEVGGDVALVSAVGEFFHALLSPLVKAQSRQQLIYSLVHCNAGEMLFRALKNVSSTIFGKADVGIINGFQVVAKLASKDTKLAMKCRLVGGIKFIHQLIRANVKNNPLLQALLMVLKFISKNATNQVALGKDGCVSTMVSLLTEIPKNHWTKLKLILENLALLTKTTSVIARLSCHHASQGLSFGPCNGLTIFW